MEWRDGKLDRLRESTQMTLTVDLFVDGRYSSNNTSDLRPEAIGPFLDETVAITRLIASDEHRKLPDPARFEGRFTGDLGLWDQSGAASVDAQERRRVAKALYEAARSAPGAERVVSATAHNFDDLTESALVTSNGMEGSQRATNFWSAVFVSVQGEGDRKPTGWDYAGVVARSRLPAIEAMGREATRRALAEVGAKPEPSGRYGCVVEGRVVGRLLRGLQRPLDGNSIQQRRSFLADKLGQAITSPVLSVTDDPLLSGGLGSRTYDREGMAATRRPVLEAGVLRSFFLDTYYASKLGQEPTTGKPGNLVFAPGERDLVGLVATMDRGILVTGFSGGNSNAATGDFSIGIKGQWVEGGKVVRPVAEMNLAGNHLAFWKQLAEVGNDPFEHATVRAPSMRFEDVQFSGS